MTVKVHALDHLVINVADVARSADWGAAGVKTVRAIGDCLAPGTIAAAVWEGHRYAQELEAPSDRGDTVPFRREVTELAGD